MAELPSGTVTFLFTDIEGSTRLWEEQPDAMRGALARHNAILEDAVVAHGGMVFDRTGDGMVAAFASARDAVEAAVAAQRGLEAESWPDAVGVLWVRMGVHSGEGVVVDGRYLNQPLNRCARLMAIAHGGQVLVSGATEALLGDDLSDGASLHDLGEHRLRDLSRPMRVFQVRHPALRSDFPPLRSLDAFPGNLPLQVSSFIGRERELARGIEALHVARVVTLTGVGGVGKTRLALQLAGEVLSRFRDGAWLVELAAVRDPERVPDTFASVFGVAVRTDQSVDEALVEFLGTKQLLLVVDNCEHVLEAVGDLVESLEQSCGGVVVLATSREGLALDGERVLAVPPLASPASDADLDAITRADSVALFIERARRVDDHFELSGENASSVAQVCRRLDGVPLAIELAAARVRAMTPAELARGLDRRFEILAGGRRRAVERHQTLRAAIDWSYDLLSEPERRLLARMAVFAGGCTREGAEAVCGGDPIEPSAVFRLLSGLVDRSLVVAEQDGPDTRYRLLETIREYAEERLAEHDETMTLRSRHAEHYYNVARTLSESAGPDQIEAGRRLSAEHENLLAGSAHAVDTDDVDLALRILTAAAGNPAYLTRFPVDALGLEGATEHPLYPRGLAIAAVNAAWQGDLQAAEELCEAALSAAGRLDSRDSYVDYCVSSARGGVALALGAFTAAAAHYEQSAKIARSAGLLQAAARSLGSGAVNHLLAGDHDRALPLATEGLALARRLGAPVLIVSNLTLLAGALTHQDPEQARALLRESSQIRATLGRVDRDASFSYVLVQGAVVAAGLEDWDQVLELASGPIRGLHWLGERPRLGRLLNVVARAIAPVDAESAALLQGAAGRLTTAALREGAGSATDRTATSSGARPADTSTGGVGLIEELRHQTTDLLQDSLGEPRLRELRAEGEAMDDDHVVAVALGAITRARAGALE